MGDTRYILRHVVYDDGYNADRATANVQRMIAEGANFINTWGTVATVAAQPITEPAGVVTFNGASGLYAVNTEMPLTFRIAGASGTLATMTYDAFMQYQPDMTSVAIINQNNESGQGSTAAAVAAAEGVGLEVVATEFYEPGTSDYYPTLQKMLDADPDIIDISSSVEHGVIGAVGRVDWVRGSVHGPAGERPGRHRDRGAENIEGYFGFMAMDRESEYNTPEQNALRIASRPSTRRRWHSITCTSTTTPSSAWPRRSRWPSRLRARPWPRPGRI